MSENPFGRIVVATDGDASGRAAARLGAELARRRESKAVLVHAAMSAPEWPWSGGPPEDVVAYFDEIAAEATAESEQILRAAGVDVEVVLVHDLPPADAILDTAGRYDADLIVVGHHNRGPIGRAMLGSVSSRVVHQAKCPVLIAQADAG